MTSTFAARTRPFISPYNIAALQSEAVQHRNDYDNERKKEIKRLISDAPSDNKEEFYWTMVYDLEMAPTCTTRALLLEQGIVSVPPHELSSSQDLHDELWTIIEAMSKCGIYLLNTDHLTDRDLYCRLYYRILDESVRMMPPASEAAEYIDCLHPMDLDYPIGKSLLDRGLPVPSGAPYFRGQIQSIPGHLGDRDAYLPRPACF